MVQYNMILHNALQWLRQNINQEFELTKGTPYLTFTDKLWGVYHEDLGENWPCYCGTVRYASCNHCVPKWLTHVTSEDVLRKQREKRWKKKNAHLTRLFVSFEIGKTVHARWSEFKPSQIQRAWGIPKSIDHPIRKSLRSTTHIHCDPIWGAHQETYASYLGWGKDYRQVSNISRTWLWPGNKPLSEPMLVCFTDAYMRHSASMMLWRLVAMRLDAKQD